ncbi:hypothetical protein ACHAXT_010724 [Thalassiosira profunda]
MGFLIKKRLAQAAAATSSSSASPSDASGSGANASGLDLLSTLAASQHSTVHPRTVSEASLSVSSAASYAAPTPKRARTFPDTLRELLEDPEIAPSIASWLPSGDSFAIHDAARFQSVVLPKYFRKVIFRSFVRKLNRWGFRTVKRSVSGCESTFEHPSFRRDRPELATQMRCHSKAAPPKKGSPAASSVREAAVSPPSGSADAFSAVRGLPRPSEGYDDSGTNEDFPVALTRELLLREMQRRREEVLLQIAGYGGGRTMDGATPRDEATDLFSRRF